MSDPIPNVLACDVGNTTIEIAVVRGKSVTARQSFRQGDLVGLGAAIADLWASMDETREIVAASVNAAGLKALEAAAHDVTGCNALVVGVDTPLPIDTAVDNPQSVGVDRLCAAAAAFDHLGTACVVADFGSAITIDCVNDRGVFLGGAISPGLSMSAKALHENTAQLPLVEELAEPEGVFGKSTRQAITGGIVHSARGALRGLVESYATELGAWPLVILTGGDAKLIARDLVGQGFVQAVVDDLVLRGVALSLYRGMLERRARGEGEA